MVSKTSYVRYEKRGRAAYITINRPEVMNALNLRAHEELQAIWEDFESDDSLWLGVLAGEGTKAFSVGQDLKELVDRTDGGEAASSFGSRGRPGWPRLTERFSLSKPIIAKVNGYALGGGLELALACDIIVASHCATFGLPEARLGLVAGAGGLFRLPKAIPHKVAVGYLMTGRSFTAGRAYELGLVNEVVPLGELDFAVQRWVDDVLRCAPLAVRAIKEVTSRAQTMDLATAFTTTYASEEKRRDSLDCIEGPRAFVEKRAPCWKGE
jgi:crotonobetainyl-CoA hydratase/dehydration protein DpgD